MGRGKPPLELIKNEKIRHSTFHKRKLGLKKKLKEFQILCNVEVCMIVYGPSNNNDGYNQNLDVFPEKPEDVKKIMARYTSTHDQQVITSRNFNLSDYYENRVTKIKDDILKTRRARYKEKYPAWYDGLLDASADQLMEVLGSIDRKIEYVNLLCDMATVNQQQSTTLGMFGYKDMLSFDPQSYPGDHNVYYQQHDQVERNYNGQLNNLNVFNQLCFDHAAQGVAYMPPNYFDPTSGLLESMIYANNSFGQNGNLCIGYNSIPTFEQESNMTSNKASDVMLPAAIHSQGANKAAGVNERVYNFDDLLMLN